LQHGAISFIFPQTLSVNIMGTMSDLHVLASEVVEGDVSLEEQVSQSAYPREEIEWAIDTLKSMATLQTNAA
jgi:hypothetical protein